MDNDLADEEIPKALTLPNLLLVMAFTATVTAVYVPMKVARIGAVRLLVVAVPALLVGASIVWIEWKLLLFLLHRLSKASKGWQNVVALGILAVMVLWLILGTAVGLRVGSLLAKLLS